MACSEKRKRINICKIKIAQINTLCYARFHTKTFLIKCIMSSCIRCKVWKLISLCFETGWIGFFVCLPNVNLKKAIIRDSNIRKLFCIVKCCVALNRDKRHFKSNVLTEDRTWWFWNVTKMSLSLNLKQIFAGISAQYKNSKIWKKKKMLSQWAHFRIKLP